MVPKWAQEVFEKYRGYDKFGGFVGKIEGSNQGYGGEAPRLRPLRGLRSGHLVLYRHPERSRRVAERLGFDYFRA